MDEIDKAAIQAMKETNYCTKHNLYHGQKYKSCTPIKRKMVKLAPKREVQEE